MTDMTPLDTAHAAMAAAPDDDAARLQFYERLGDSALFLLLTEEAQGDTLSPEVFDVTGGQYVLAFDREDRLAAFTNTPAPYAALSGRVIAQMLAGQGIGLGLNLDVAPSSTLIPTEALVWLQDTLAHAPQEVEARPSHVLPPAGLPETVVTALSAKLSAAAGLADCAWLAGVRYANGDRHGYLLAFVDAAEGAEAALAKAVGEALTFSGLSEGAMDVGFFDGSDPMVAHLQKCGLRFDLPRPPRPEQAKRQPPGSDPARPPILTRGGS